MAAAWVRCVAHWIQRVAFLAGVVCLAWVYVTWKNAAFYQLHAKAELNHALAAAGLPRDAGRLPTIDLTKRDDSLIGVLDVPRVGLSVAVLDRDDDSTLRLAVGHVAGTPLPWKAGNTALAGHRDTFFRPLENVRVGDEMSLATRHGTFQYRVRRIIVVGPGDLWVLDSSNNGIGLTLITCYPFNYLGFAPERFVVQAERLADGE